VEKNKKLYALNYDHVQKGTVRETCFMCILRHSHNLSMPASGAFWIDNDILIEVDGKNKDTKQLKGNKKAI